MCEQYTSGYLADVSTLATHVGSSNNLQVRFTRNHSAPVADARSWISYFNQWMPALHQAQLLVLVHLWLDVLIVA